MIDLVLPLIVASLAAAIVAPLLEYITPVAARRASMTVLISVAASAMVFLAHLSMRGIVAIPILGPRLHSVLHLDGVHVVQSGLVGSVALFVVIFVVFKSVTMLVSRKKIRDMHPGGVLTVSDSRLFAFAVPGRRPGIIMSDSLVSSLSQEELHIVLRHERAHIEGRHDRWIFAATLCALINPFLTPMKRQLELSLERIADEAAKRECGDARKVMRALSKVALSKQDHSIALGIASSSVPARIRWLKNGVDHSHPALTTIVALGCIAITSLALIQGHHIAVAVQSICL
jgi:Zn-dependent protease with chaperone function